MGRRKEGKSLCSVPAKKKGLGEVCTKTIRSSSFPSTSLSSSDAPLYTRNLLSSCWLLAIPGQLQRHHQPPDSSFESSAESPLPSPLGRVAQNFGGQTQRGHAQPRFDESKPGPPAATPLQPLQRPIERDALKRSIGLLLALYSDLPSRHCSERPRRVGQRCTQVDQEGKR